MPGANEGANTMSAAVIGSTCPGVPGLSLVIDERS